MDCTRYLVLSGLVKACVRPPSMWKRGNQSSQHQYEYDPSAMK
jgi:hypothetical protein